MMMTISILSTYITENVLKQGHELGSVCAGVAFGNYASLSMTTREGYLEHDFLSFFFWFSKSGKCLVVILARSFFLHTERPKLHHYIVIVIGDSLLSAMYTKLRQRSKISKWQECRRRREMLCCYCIVPCLTCKSGVVLPSPSSSYRRRQSISPSPSTKQEEEGMFYTRSAS